MSVIHRQVLKSFMPRPRPRDLAKYVDSWGEIMYKT